MYVEIFFVAMFAFSAPYAIFFAYSKYYAKKPWKIEINEDFQPAVSILIPTHNEQAVILKKLENLAAVSYSKEKIEIIVADDASEDETLLRVESFVTQHPDLNIKIIKQTHRAGKSPVLNLALPLSANSIVIVSDAETFWPPEILQKALPYLADPKVGAISGRGLNENGRLSWVTKSEDAYLDVVGLIKRGESKIQSTLRFEGGFCAYKKEAFAQFDQETGADDSGTALYVVLNNYATIGVPEAIFYTSFPTGFRAKLKIKERRANHLISLWLKCSKLLLKGRLPLSRKIAIPEIMLLIVNPILFFVLILTSVVSVLLFPFSLFSIALLLIISSLLIGVRKIFLEILLDNGILLYALVNLLIGRRYISWEKPKF